MSAPAHLGEAACTPDTLDKYPRIRSLFPEDAATAAEHLDWPTGPVLMLRYSSNSLYPGHWNPEHTGATRWKERRPGSSSAAFGSALHDRGFDISDVTVIRPPGSWCISCRLWPRNLVWRDLPVVGDAVFLPEPIFTRRNPIEDCGAEKSVPSVSWKFGDEVMRNAPLLRRLSFRVQLYVIDAAEYDVRHLVDLAHILEFSPPDGIPQVAWFDGKTMRDVALAEVESARRRWRAEERFVHSHAINTIILGSRALYRAAWEENWPRRLVEIRMPRLDQFTDWLFGHPIALQFLHLLNRIGGGPSVDCAMSSIYDDEIEHVRANPCLELSDDETRFWFVWRGTGYYPAWRAGPYPVRSKDALAMTPRAQEEHPMYGIPGRLMSADLIGRNTEGRWVLTEAGKRFLELIGPETDDQDVLLRWRTPDGLLGTEDDIPAMDRWLNRAFRALKRRVASLPASPFAEHGVEWHTAGCHKKLVRGHSLTLEQDDLLDPAVAVALDDLRAKTAGQGWRDRRVGVEEPEMHLRAPDTKVTVWAGVPLGVFNGGGLRQLVSGSHYDLSEIDAEAEAALADLPEILACHPKLTALGMEEVAWTDAKCTRFIEFRRALPPEDSGQVATII